MDAAPELGARLSERDREESRERAILPSYELPVGDWELSELEWAGSVNGSVHGFLVCEGLLTLDVRFAARTCMRALVTGDIVFFDGIEVDSISSSWGWSALEPSHLAIFDERLLVIGRRWPQLLAAIITRASEQTRQAHLQQAISQLPRVEDRLIALFWSLADRAGTSGPDGVAIPINLKHATIAQMIGARRPTVTLALTSLAEQGLLARQPSGWRLDRRSLALFNGPPPPEPPRSQDGSEVADA